MTNYSRDPLSDGRTASKWSGQTKVQMPPLQMVRAFEAVARTGSMRKAADDLGVSHNVISYHIRNLEAWLGTRLLLRSAAGTRLNEEGRDFFETVSKAFGEIAAASERIRARATKDILRLWCMAGLASQWLTSRLSDLEQSLPGTEIVIRAIDQIPDFARQEADATIVYARQSELPAGALLLASPRMFPVASPAWLSRNEPPLSLQDLPAGPLIHEGSHKQWQEWLAAAGLAHTPRPRGPHLGNADLCLEAALAGQGIALALYPMASGYLAQNQLVELLDTDIRLGGYFLVISPSRREDPLMTRFRAWLDDHLGRLEDRGRTQPQT